MKNLLLILLFISGIFLSCKEPEKEKDQFFPYDIVQYHTWEEVQDAARQYGLESVILEKNNNGLMYLPDSALHAFLKNEKAAQEGKAEMVLYLDKKKDIHSFDDYLDLLNSLPHLKALKIESKGGEAAFQQWVEERKKINWHIYLNDDGSLAWVRPEDDHGTRKGKRLDRNK